jgi:hypothetical protein
MHRNNQDMMVYSLSLAPPASFNRWRVGTPPDHSIGGYGAQFRFYLPAQCPGWGRLDVNGVAVKELRRLTFPQVVFIGIAPK